MSFLLTIRRVSEVHVELGLLQETNWSNFLYVYTPSWTKQLARRACIYKCRGPSWSLMDTDLRAFGSPVNETLPKGPGFEARPTKYHEESAVTITFCIWWKANLCSEVRRPVDTTRDVIHLTGGTTSVSCRALQSNLCCIYKLLQPAGVCKDHFTWTRKKKVPKSAKSVSNLTPCKIQTDCSLQQFYVFQLPS